MACVRGSVLVPISPPPPPHPSFTCSSPAYTPHLTSLLSCRIKFSVACQRSLMPLRCLQFTVSKTSSWLCPCLISLRFRLVLLLSHLRESPLSCLPSSLSLWLLSPQCGLLSVPHPALPSWGLATSSRDAAGGGPTSFPSVSSPPLPCVWRRITPASESLQSLPFAPRAESTLVPAC